MISGLTIRGFECSKCGLGFGPVSHSEFPLTKRQAAWVWEARLKSKAGGCPLRVEENAGGRMLNGVFARIWFKKGHVAKIENLCYVLPFSA